MTSYVFKDGRINYANLNRLKDTVGSDRLVLDLSCRKKDGQYYIVTDRWQNFTDEAVTTELWISYPHIAASFWYMQWMLRAG